MKDQTKNLMVLSSIAECRKAIDFLSQAGELSVTTVMLRGEKHPCPKSPANDMPMYRGHQLILRDDNTLECRLCGRKYRSVRQELTREERYLYETLSPKCSFERQAEL